MANTTINEVNPFLTGTVKNAAKGQNVQGTESFSAVFDKTQTTEQKQPDEGKKKKVENPESIQNHAKIQKKRTSENVKESENVKTGADAEEVEKAVETAAGMMVETVAATLDMTEEEVKQVMEELGLTAVDLLNSDHLTQLVIHCNPEADAFSIMTNEELFADLKGLMNTAQELTEQLSAQLGITKEEVIAFADAWKQQPLSEEAVKNPTGEVLEGMLETEPEMTEIPAEVVVEETEPATDFEVKSEGFETKEPRFFNLDDTVEATVLPKTKDVENGQKDFRESRNDFSHNGGKEFGQQVWNQLTEAVENTQTETNLYGVNSQDILRQITDYIKVHVGQDTTEMELQLHPASLGNIKVQIASNGGVITATFTTENEVVKAALESQMVQLKENFEQQGLKVENVEVNVSAQGFERNLDQQDQNRQDSYASQTKKTRTRRIRFDGPEENREELVEGLSEGDRIIADMMQKNGNQVDYTV